MCAATLLGISPASAQPAPDRVARARRLYQEGTAHYQAGRLNEARDALLQAWRLVPGPALAFNVARVYERMGDPPNAIRFYQEYLRRQRNATDRADIQNRITQLQALQRRQREQIVTLPPSRDALTQEARTFFMRGVAMFRRRRYDAARQAFTAAYQFARLPEVVFNLAVASERVGQRQEAIDYYREYLRLRRNGPDRPLVERRIRELRAGRGTPSGGGRSGRGRRRRRGR